MRRALTLLGLCALLQACPAASDADAGADGGEPVLSCGRPEDCHLAGLDAVCREGVCQPRVPCADDLECGLGERCLGETCHFTGCVADADCPTGRCLTDSYACVECGTNADCTPERPLCDATTRTCVGCLSDSQCQPPGPPYCSPEGACVHCLADLQCPNGLHCSGKHVCEGALLGAACPQGIACAQGLICVTVGSNNQCLRSCDLYRPVQCGSGQICYALSYSNSASLVFESTGPIGVCYQPVAGARGLREACTRSAAGTNCEPNLQCIPDSASINLCRAYCDPLSPACAAGEVCQSFVGDYLGRSYGLCLPDAGFGIPCSGDGTCRPGLSCQAYDSEAAASGITTLCQFNQGPRTGLSPCAPLALSDGGTLASNRLCNSGLCTGDPVLPAPTEYFCFEACAKDADCSVGGRTGFCDGSFPTTTAFGTLGNVKGCRPECTSNDACAQYDAGVVCWLRSLSGAQGRLTATCSPPYVTGAQAPGTSCTANSQCHSGLCLLADARGVARGGVCTEACTTPAQCASPDAGLPLSCQPTAVLVWNGSDFVANTADDVVSVRSLCSGAGCTTDADCQADGGTSLCVPERDPAQPGTSVVLRCRPPTSGIKVAGQTCASDAECASGACGTLQAPSVGAGQLCFQACAAGSSCAGTTTCRQGGMQLAAPAGPVNVDSCAP